MWEVGVNSSQGTIAKTFTHLFTYYEQLGQCQPAYSTCLWTRGGNTSTWRKHEENVQNPHMQELIQYYKVMLPG